MKVLNANVSTIAGAFEIQHTLGGILEDNGVEVLNPFDTYDVQEFLEQYNQEINAIVIHYHVKKDISTLEDEIVAEIDLTNFILEKYPQFEKKIIGFVSENLREVLDKEDFVKKITIIDHYNPSDRQFNISRVIKELYEIEKTLGYKNLKLKEFVNEISA